MMLNCKVYQPSQLSSQNQSPYIPSSQKTTDNCQSAPPKQQSFQICTDTRKACVQPENCHFKIRTFSTKSNNKRGSIQGKCLKNVLVIQGNKKMKFQPIEEPTTLTNKCIEGQKYNRNYVMRPKKPSKNDAVFNAISIIKTNEKKSLAFKQQNYSFLKALAHKPIIKLNQNGSGTISDSLVLIISLRCLNNETLKYWKNNQKGFHSQKNVEANNDLPFQTMNLLRTLSGSGSKESWLGQSQLFYKVDNSRQMDLVYSYLTENNLPFFTGILNSQKKVTETYTIYSLQALLSKDSHLLLIQDYQTLQTQFPLLQGHRFACISPKAASYVNIYPFVSCLKDATFQISAKKISLQKSYLDLEKENISSNCFTQDCLSKLNHCETQKVPICSKVELRIGVNLEKDFIHLEVSKLTQMAKQASKIKEIRKTIKQVRQKSAEHRIPSAQNASKYRPLLREKYTSKDQSVIENQQSPRIGRFQGEFKDKLVKLVKILENEKKDLRFARKTYGQFKKQSENEGKRQGNDLQFITECMTSKLKCKTGYQLVGDLVKSNMHINRQISKYLNNIKGVEQCFDCKKQTGENGNKRFLEPTSFQKELQVLPIYYF